MDPGYLSRNDFGSLTARTKALRERMSQCRICPHECGVRRIEGERGTCRLAAEVIVASAHPHFGEEKPLVGRSGSGTIFFSSCNLRCEYCQNSHISHSTAGWPVGPRELGRLMTSLQAAGCHNINLVTPTHVAAGIVEALIWAIRGGLRIPIVYNCGGYESVETLALLDGIVDIYLPDMKYSVNEAAVRLSGAPNYWERSTAALREMHRQVGDLVTDSRGIAERGLLIRHLVLPNRVAGSRTILDFIASEISTDSYVNIMDQYRPVYHAAHHSEIARSVKSSEYLEVLEHAYNVGLHRGLPSP